MGGGAVGVSALSGALVKMFSDEDRALRSEQQALRDRVTRLEARADFFHGPTTVLEELETKPTG